MDLLEQLCRSIEYIEDNITNEEALPFAYKVTSYSSYHFNRIFNYITGIPISEYIRRRKMSFVAIELQNSKTKIIDLAVKYGYDSADSFTRVFVKQHGVTPTAARKSGVNFQIYPPLTFQIKIIGVQNMNWRIEEREEFEIFGIEKYFKNEESSKIKLFWDEVNKNGSKEKLIKQANVNTPMAVCGHIDDNVEEFSYIICCEVKENVNTQGFKVVKIPKTTWAVFRTDNMKNHNNCQLPDLFYRAYTQWLPSSGYDKASGPDMEIYGDLENGEVYQEAWIPVVKV